MNCKVKRTMNWTCKATKV